MAFHAAFTLFSGSRARWIDCKLVGKASMGAAISSTLRELSLEEMKKEQRQTPEAIGLDSRKNPPASTPDAKADDCTGDCTWAGMTTKLRKTAMFWNLYKNTHLFARNIRHTLDNFSNYSLIYLTRTTYQTGFFYTALIFSCHFNVLLLLFNNNSTMVVNI